MSDLLFHNVTPISVGKMKPSDRLRLAARVVEDTLFIPSHLNDSVLKFLDTYLYDAIKNNEKKVALEFKEGESVENLAFKYSLTKDQVLSFIRKNIDV